MKPFLTALAVCVSMLAPASSEAASWVLPPEAASEVGALIGNARPLAGGQGLTAALDGDHVVVSVLDGETPVTRITLRHPSRGEAGAETVGGVIVDRTPGPVDDALLTELLARMRESAAEVHWVDASARPASGGGHADDTVRSALREARLGRAERARELLATLPADLEPGQAVRAALVWRRLGDDARVRALLPAPEKLSSPAVAKALVTPDDLAGVLAAVGDGDACAAVDAADVLAELGRHELARDLAEQLRERAPGCVRAWTRAIFERLRLGEREEAAARLTEALKRFPGDAQVATARAAVLGGAETPTAEAVTALEGLVVARPNAPGQLAALADLIARLPDAERDARRARDREALARDPHDVVARFLVGSEALRLGDFERAREVLEPLTKTLRDVPAIPVALAVARFELGDADGALKLLDAAEAMPTLDPDAFYERAEILRERDLEGARAALKTYLDGCDSVGCHDVERQERAGTLLQLVERCISEHARTCDGDWEHPRATGTAPPLPAVPKAPPETRAPAAPSTDAAPAAPADDGGDALVPIVVGVAALMLLALLLLLLRRRKKM